MRETNPSSSTALLVAISLAAATLASGCGASLRSYEYRGNVIRIDESEGAAHARVFVDECPVEGMYYDRVARQWGVQGYTYGASYWHLDELAEDMASVGAARCRNGRVGEPPRGDLASR